MPNCEEFECVYAIRFMSEDIRNAKREVVCCSLKRSVCDYQSGKQGASCVAYREKIVQENTESGEDGCNMCCCVSECDKAQLV